MAVGRAVLIGGGGFIGSHLAQALAASGVEVVIPTRRRERIKPELIVLPTADVVQADVHDDQVLDRLLAGADAVVNLVGILHERRRGDFARAHVELPRRVAAACRRAGVRRLLHMSALGAAPDAPSLYLRTKGEAEAMLRSEAAGGALDLTIFRPSVVFGRGDSFLTLFARLLALMPVVVLGSPGAKFQPVWVEDVADAFVRSLADRATIGHSYDLCGPTVYTLRELIELVARATGRKRLIIGLGDRLSYLQALMMELSPVKVLTRDNYRSMQVDNVCGCAWPEAFPRRPAALEAVLPTYLGDGPSGRNRDLRVKARR